MLDNKVLDRTYSKQHVDKVELAGRTLQQENEKSRTDLQTLSKKLLDETLRNNELKKQNIVQHE